VPEACREGEVKKPAFVRCLSRIVGRGGRYEDE
jgi:hypothetical protein